LRNFNKKNSQTLKKFDLGPLEAGFLPQISILSDSLLTFDRVAFNITEYAVVRLNAPRALSARELETMDWNFDVHGLPGFIRVKTRGQFNKDHFADMIDELVGKDYFQMGSRILVDSSELELDQMSDREMIEARNALVVQNKSLAYSKMAFVTRTEDLPVAYKLAKITQHGSRAIMQIFDDENVALQWLVGLARVQSFVS
jgi:hypothetical protein